MTDLLKETRPVLPVKFDEIPILKFGNDLVIKGVIMEMPQGADLLVYLPNEGPGTGFVTLQPNRDEWYKMQDQLDHCDVEGEAGVILRKGQRQLDQKICWAVYRRDRYKCRYCGVNNVPLTVDHIVTWETGGATHPDNLLTCCRKCNRRRGNLDYGSWLQHRHYTEKAEKYLTEAERAANEAIVRNIPNLPKVAKPRGR
jgi:hypothetical protein